jgi:hypothetical protein
MGVNLAMHGKSGSRKESKQQPTLEMDNAMVT